MKRTIFAVAVMMLSVSAGAISRSEHANARKAALAPVYQNDGDSVVVFVVTPTTHTWTQVRAANAVRRRLDIEMVNNGTTSTIAGVCLSTTSNASSPCDNARGGYELILSTPQPKVSLSGQTAWYARIRGGDANAAVLRGADYYDSGD